MVWEINITLNEKRKVEIIQKLGGHMDGSAQLSRVVQALDGVEAKQFCNLLETSLAHPICRLHLALSPQHY